MSSLHVVAFTALASACALACLDGELVRVGDVDPDGGVDDEAPPDAGFGTALEMITAFGRCMSYTDWIDAQLNQLPIQATAEGDICAACHAGQGAGGAFLSEDALETLEHHREPPSVYKIALPIHDPDSLPPFDVVPNDRYVAKGVGEDGHPTYVLDPTVEEGLDRFFELTWARFAERKGDCPPAE